MTTMGRPTKVSSKLAAEVAAYVRRGMTLAEAAEAAGLDRSSLFNYLKSSEPEMVAFAKVVRQAQREHGKKAKK